MLVAWNGFQMFNEQQKGEVLSRWKRNVDPEGPPLHEGVTVIFNIERLRLKTESSKG